VVAVNLGLAAPVMGGCRIVGDAADQRIWTAVWRACEDIDLVAPAP
jgi:hypothetical protein